jgi:serine/threonine-protein kinase RsbT
VCTARDGNKSGNFELRVPISCAEDVVEARKQGRILAADLGFSPSEGTMIAAAISELARNIVTYAGRGEIVLRDDADCMVVIAQDQGPGIPDTQAALRPGYSTSGGLGLGLPGVRRIADHFEIASNSKGTRVTLRKKKR